jgi:hypothetical protein
MPDCMLHAHSSPCPICAMFSTEERERRRRRLKFVFLFVAALMVVCGAAMCLHGWPAELAPRSEQRAHGPR